MKVTVKIRDLTSNPCKHIIVRNLSRILDIRILDIDIESKTISFVYDNALALEKAKRELWRIGFPILKFLHQEPTRMEDSINYRAHTIAY